MLNIDSLDGVVALDAAGIVALADLKTIQNRTALTGSASVFDTLFLAPGIHCQQDAGEVNGCEYPKAGMLCPAKEGGYYVFNIGNQATIFWLQRVAKTGKLVEVTVSPGRPHYIPQSEILPAFLYFVGCSGTAAIIGILCAARDFWGMCMLLTLAVARMINVIIIRRRAEEGWKGGTSTSGRETDLLIILSKDRWIRMRGSSDDVMAVIAGRWLRDTTNIESYATSFATLLVYAAAALAGNATTMGSALIGCLLLTSAGLLGLVNAHTRSLHMFGRVASVVGVSRPYPCRRKMVDDLISETQTREWAYNMELIPRAMDAPSAAVPNLDSRSLKPSTRSSRSSQPYSCASNGDAKDSAEAVQHAQQPRLDV